MIKVLQVFSLTDRGGAESLIMTHYKYIDRQQFHFDFVNHTQRQCDYDDEIYAMGSKLYHLPRFRYYNIFPFLKAWDDFLAVHHDYDVIHVHYFTLAGLIMPIAKKHKIKLRIAHSHTSIMYSFYKRVFFSLFTKQILMSSNLLLACSEDAGKNIFKTDKFRVFTNAINIKDYKYDDACRVKVRRDLGYKDDEIVIGHVGSFRGVAKNHLFIIDVFSRLVAKYPKFRLLLIGDGQLRSQIEKKVQDYGIFDYVTFTGVRADVPQLLQGMDVFFFPSLYEGLGIAVVEAQAAGLPVVASSEIPEEAYISDLIQTLSLSSNVEEWVDTLIKASQRNDKRSAYNLLARDGNYDVVRNSWVLEEIYREGLK